MIAPAMRQQVLSLDDADKAEVIGLLLDSLAGADPHDADLDSLSEAIQRGEELASGAVRGLSKDEFWQGLRRE